MEKHLALAKQRLARSSAVGQDNSSTTTSEKQDSPTSIPTFPTSSSVGPPRIALLIDPSGRVAVYTWSESSKQWTRVTSSCWVTLPCELLQSPPGS